jgi:hypothetical protein
VGRQDSVVKSDLPFGDPARFYLAEVPVAKKREELLPKEEDFAKAMSLESRS